MKAKELNNLLKLYDLGDDFLDNKNLLFDPMFTSLSRPQFVSGLSFANEEIDWYWTDLEKHYLLADCNRFHFVWLGSFQTWCTRNGIANPAIGRAYGYWEGQNHAWAYASVENDLVFINWGQEINPRTVSYDGKGSEAV